METFVIRLEAFGNDSKRVILGGEGEAFVNSPMKEILPHAGETILIGKFWAFNHTTDSINQDIFFLCLKHAGRTKNFK